jgi:hypothetical protein
MNKRLLRRVAISLIGLLIFAQASVTLAHCPMDRGMLSLAIGAGEEPPCIDCGTSVSGFGSLYANRCVSHCTADLQVAGLPLALVPQGTYAPVFQLEAPAPDFGLAALHAPPPGEVPRRILLHSYLI